MSAQLVMPLVNFEEQAVFYNVLFVHGVGLIAQVGARQHTQIKPELTVATHALNFIYWLGFTQAVFSSLVKERTAVHKDLSSLLVPAPRISAFPSHKTYPSLPTHAPYHSGAMDYLGQIWWK